MKKSIRVVYKILFAISCLLILCIVIALSAFQTPWGRNFINQTIQQNLQEQGVDLSYETLSGALPFYWKFTNVKIGVEDAPTVTIDTFKFRISLWRLLQKQIYLRDVEGHHVSYEMQENSRPRSEIEETLGAVSKLPFSISMNSVNFYDVHPSYSKEKTVDLEGRIHLARHGRYLLMNITSKNPKRVDTTLQLRLKADRKKGVQARFDLRTPDLRGLAPYWDAGLEAEANLQIYASGSWDAFEHLLFFNTEYNQRIRGRIKGTFEPKFSSSSMFTQNLLEPIWQIKGNFSIYPNISFRVHPIVASNSLLSMKLSTEQGGNFRLDQARLDIRSQNLEKVESDFPISGILDITAQLKKETEGIFCSINGTAYSLSLSKVDIDPLEAQISGYWKDPLFQGTATASFNFIDLPWEAEGGILWAWKQDVHFNHLSMVSPTALLTSDFTLNSDLMMNGLTNISVSDLSSLLEPFPNTDLYGAMEGRAYWFDRDDAQAVQLDLNFFDSLFNELKARSAHVELLAKETFSDPVGYISIELEEAHYHGIELNTALIMSTNESENWYYSFDGKGDWKGPFDIQTSGFYNIHSEEKLFNVQELGGFVFNHSFEMPNPLLVTWTDNSLNIDEFELSLANSHLKMQGKVTEEQSDIQIDLQHFPLDFLSLNQLDLDVAGYTNMHLDIHQGKNIETKGELSLQLEELKIWAINDQKPLAVSGQFHSQLEGENLNFVGHLDTNEVELMHVKADLPFSLNIYPFKALIDTDSNAHVRFGYDGPVEEILDFINLGPQHLEGDLSCGFDLSNTLSEPKVEGVFRLRDGVYENYFSGTYLQNIEADLFADRYTLHLKSLTATDGAEGKLRASGDMSLDPDKNFPFKVESKFSKIECLRFDSVSAFAKGNIEFTGTTKGALAKGDFNVTRADISIPEKITKEVPEVEVTYVHKNQEVPPKVHVQEELTYPIDMELKISAPDNVFVSGRGVSSKWKGDFRVGGQYPDLLAKGRLDMIHGEFVFSGRVFELNEGNLIFSGQEGQEPYLNVSGRLSEQEFTIIASMKGNITSPKLDFRSIPSLPLSSILSYLIFGQDISSLTPFQAVQLATAIASLAGGGPDILETTRRTLSVDRLAFITQPTNTSDGSEVALKVGKYVTKGVLVSVAQGIGLDSTNIIVEVDLKKGFIFQAESQQQQAQGKFTLKWSRNY